VGLDDCRVDHGVLRVRISAERIEYPIEYSSLNSAMEPLESAVPIAELSWPIPPGRIRPNNPKYRFKERTRFASSPPRRCQTTGTQELTCMPLKIRENSSAPVISNCLSRELNRKSDQMGILNVHEL
jgi:hypothetical protein